LEERLRYIVVIDTLEKSQRTFGGIAGVFMGTADRADWLAVLPGDEKIRVPVLKE
jgi:hypothetical protein